MITWLDFEKKNCFVYKIKLFLISVTHVYKERERESEGKMDRVEYRDRWITESLIFGLCSWNSVYIQRHHHIHTHTYTHQPVQLLATRTAYYYRFDNLPLGWVHFRQHVAWLSLQAQDEVSLPRGPTEGDKRLQPNWYLASCGFFHIQCNWDDSVALTTVHKLSQKTTVHFDLGCHLRAAGCLVVFLEVLRCAYHQDILTLFDARLFPCGHTPIAPDLILAVGFKVQGEALVLYELGKLL